MDILQLIIHDIAITPSKNGKRKKIKLEFKYFDIIKSANEGGHFSLWCLFTLANCDFLKSNLKETV